MNIQVIFQIIHKTQLDNNLDKSSPKSPLWSMLFSRIDVFVLLEPWTDGVWFEGEGWWNIIENIKNVSENEKTSEEVKEFSWVINESWTWLNENLNGEEMVQDRRHWRRILAQLTV